MTKEQQAALDAAIEYTAFHPTLNRALIALRDAKAKSETRDDGDPNWIPRFERIENEQRAEIARLVELGRSAETKIKALETEASTWRGRADEHFAQVKDLTENLNELSRLTSAERDNLVAKINELERRAEKPTKAEVELHHLTTAGTRAAPPWQMRKPVEEPDPRPLTEAERKRLLELAKPKASELETMLTALMGPELKDQQHRWSWGHNGKQVAFCTDRNEVLYPNTPAEALRAINARLAELAPKGWRLSVTPSDHSGASGYDLTVLRRGIDSRLRHISCGIRGGCRCAFNINGDLGARIAEALKWIAAQAPSTVTAQIPESTLEKMLTKLMGPANAEPVPWSWHSIRNGAVITPEGVNKFFAVWGVDAAIRSINVRLKEMSPEGWIVELNLAGDRPILSARRRSGGVYRCTAYPVDGNLRWCVEQAIAWCKAWHDFEGVKQ